MAENPLHPTAKGTFAAGHDVNGHGQAVPEGLADDQGPIPTFPPPRLDEHGRVIPISDDERRARIRAAARALAALDKLPDDDPAGSTAEMMRGIDSERLPGQKLFEGMY